MKSKLPLIAAFVAVLGLTACGGGNSGSSTTAVAAVESPLALTVTDSVVGTGAAAAVGTTPTLKYTGWLYVSAGDHKGTQFDTGTINPDGVNSAARFILGATSGNRLVAGFDQGVTGMKVGGKRTILIPSGLGYGASGSGTTVPPNSGLVFDVELTAVN
ncbi:MAG TPA: FKBP-type peptidyl-prolyl cis-trans isomerase [Telluria sp.]|nr:FKBP-type peptidyl-prolyl cis-trans isomerase [Telluria sp.]